MYSSLEAYERPIAVYGIYHKSKETNFSLAFVIDLVLQKVCSAGEILDKIESSRLTPPPGTPADIYPRGKISNSAISLRRRKPFS